MRSTLFTSSWVILRSTSKPFAVFRAMFGDVTRRLGDDLSYDKLGIIGHNTFLSLHDLKMWEMI